MATESILGKLEVKLAPAIKMRIQNMKSELTRTKDKERTMAANKQFLLSEDSFNE